MPFYLRCIFVRTVASVEHLFEKSKTNCCNQRTWQRTQNFHVTVRKWRHISVDDLVRSLFRGCEQTQPEVSAFWRGKENFVHKRFFIKYRQINIFKVKNTILYENCILWAPTAYEKYCCHPLKIKKFVPNGKPLKYQHSCVGKCH